MLEQCRLIALRLDVPHDPVIANVCRVAGSIIGTSYADAGMRLRAAAADYFSAHPADEVPAVEIVRRGWVIDLPRLRNRLERLLAAEKRT